MSNLMENIFELLDRYKQANIALSLEQERDIIANTFFLPTGLKAIRSLLHKQKVLLKKE